MTFLDRVPGPFWQKWAPRAAHAVRLAIDLATRGVFAYWLARIIGCRVDWMTALYIAWALGVLSQPWPRMRGDRP